MNRGEVGGEGMASPSADEAIAFHFLNRGAGVWSPASANRRNLRQGGRGCAVGLYSLLINAGYTPLIRQRSYYLWVGASRCPLLSRQEGSSSFLAIELPLSSP